MSTVIKFNLKELRQLANDKNSCVVEKTVTQNLALQPWCLGNIKESIKNLLDYKLWKYDKEFNGILLSYKNLRILQNVGAIRNDNAIYFPVQSDYFIFKPYVGAILKGIVNKKSVTHLGILVHRVFNVVIPRPTDEPGNTWIGSSIQENQEVVFKIVVLDLYGALPYIRGELDERYIKLTNDGDDEGLELSNNKLIDVSYVNFDKTKPIQKLTADKPESTKNARSTHTQSRNNSTSAGNNSTRNGQIPVEYEVNLPNKIKRHKISDLDTKSTDIKSSKKHKYEC